MIHRPQHLLFLLLPILALPAISTPAAERVLDSHRHHVRFGEQREWSEFPKTAEAAELLVAGEAAAATEVIVAIIEEWGAGIGDLDEWSIEGNEEVLSEAADTLAALLAAPVVDPLPHAARASAETPTRATALKARLCMASPLNRTTGVVGLRSTIHNQTGTMVLEGRHRYLLRKRHPV